MFCYTSGTTGDPKGSKIAHSAILAAMTLHDYCGINLKPGDICISYLPYAHIFEQAMLCLSLTYGFAHGFYSGDPLKLLDDI